MNDLDYEPRLDHHAPPPLFTANQYQLMSPLDGPVLRNTRLVQYALILGMREDRYHKSVNWSNAQMANILLHITCSGLVLQICRLVQRTYGARDILHGTPAVDCSHTPTDWSNAHYVVEQEST
jgi:hypothetical protein